MPAALSVRRARAALGGHVKAGNAQAAQEARRQLAAAQIETFIERKLAEAPDLSAEQRNRLAVLLRGAPATTAAA